MKSRNTNNIENGKLPLVEHFYTIQGEGFHTGKAAYFIRLGGCDVGCSWCDSRFTWNPGLHPPVEVEEILRLVKLSGAGSVVVTGGEPLMWNLDSLCAGLHEMGIEIFLETSGAYPLSGSWDWICLSPKLNAPPLEEVIAAASELKVVISGESDFAWAERIASMVDEKCLLYLQPEWSVAESVMGTIVEYVKRNSAWMISIQAHKYMRIP